MFQSLEILHTAGAMARHAAKRQALIAENVANADTPGYRARNIPDFVDVWDPDPAAGMRATRSTHLNGIMAQTLPDARVADDPESAPNGNSVSLEIEMVKAAGAKRQHDQALAIYRSATTMLRASLGRR